MLCKSIMSSLRGPKSLTLNLQHLTNFDPMNGDFATHALT